MSDRKIYCASCGTYLGVIRDAKLKKGLTFLCANCETKRIALEMKRGIKGYSAKHLFDGIFK